MNNRKIIQGMGLFRVVLLVIITFWHSTGKSEEASKLLTGVVVRLPFEDSIEPAYLANGKVEKAGKGVRFTDGFHGRGIQVLYNNPDVAGVVVNIRGGLSSRRGTISLWVRPDWFKAREYRGTCIFTVATLFQAFWDKTIVRFATYGQGRWVWGPGASMENLDPDEWHHMVFTYDENKKRIYINGELKGEDEFNPTEEWVSSSFNLAYGGHDEQKPGIDACFDEIVSWNRTLTESEVKELHKLYLIERNELIASFPMTVPQDKHPVKILMAETDRACFIWAPDEDIILRTKLLEEPSRLSRQVRFYYELINYYGKVLKTFTVKEGVMPIGQSLTDEVKFSLDEYGVFKLKEYLEVPEIGFKNSKDVASVAILPKELGERDILPKSGFGMHPVSEPWYHQIARQMGVKWVRTLDFNQICWWNNTEPKKGDFIWYDNIVDDILNNEMSILGVVFWTPRWASSNQNAPPEGIEYRYYPPKDWDDWRNFARAIVSHYKGKINHWEIWNEPHWAWKGTHEEYVKLEQIFYEEAKKVNPSCVIVGMGGVGEDLKWIENVAKLGGLEYLDVLSVHGYSFDNVNPQTLEETERFINGVKGIIKQYGKDRNIPIWNTEWTTYSASFFDELREGYGPALEKHHYRKSANTLVRKIVINAVLNIEKTFYYFMKRYDYDVYINETPTGSLLEFTGSLSPHGVAYAQAAWLLEGARFYGEHFYTSDLPEMKQVRIPVYIFSKGTGSIAILWGPFEWDKEVDSGVSVEVSGLKAKLMNIMGNPYPQNEGSSLRIPVKSEPVYIVAEGLSADTLLEKLKTGNLVKD